MYRSARAGCVTVNGAQREEAGAMQLPIRVHKRGVVKGNVSKKLAGTSVPKGSSVFEKEGKKRRAKIQLTRAMRDDLAPR